MVALIKVLVKVLKTLISLFKLEGLDNVVSDLDNFVGEE